jgi:hypothetical protein
VFVEDPASAIRIRATYHAISLRQLFANAAIAAARVGS